MRVLGVQGEAPASPPAGPTLTAPGSRAARSWATWPRGDRRTEGPPRPPCRPKEASTTMPLGTGVKAKCSCGHPWGRPGLRPEGHRLPWDRGHHHRPVSLVLSDGHSPASAPSAPPAGPRGQGRTGAVTGTRRPRSQSGSQDERLRARVSPRGSAPPSPSQGLRRGDGPHHGGVGPWAPRPQRGPAAQEVPLPPRLTHAEAASRASVCWPHAPAGPTAPAARAQAQRGVCRCPLQTSGPRVGSPVAGGLHRAGGVDVPPTSSSAHTAPGQGPTQTTSPGTWAVTVTSLVSRLPAPGQRPPTQVLNPSVFLEGQSWPGDSWTGVRPEPEVTACLPGELVTQQMPGRPPPSPEPGPSPVMQGHLRVPRSRRCPAGPPGPRFSGLLLGLSRGRHGCPVK